MSYRVLIVQSVFTVYVANVQKLTEYSACALVLMTVSVTAVLMTVSVTTVLTSVSDCCVNDNVSD